MRLEDLQPVVSDAVEAAQDKQASNITVLRLVGAGAFADYFILCSGQSAPQLHAIAEAIEEKLDRQGMRLLHREGKSGAEWVLLDYGSIVVHIFGEGARRYYDLERLWRNADRLDVSPPDQHAARSAEAERGESNP
ncbi:MAG: ribosome silencing factor [Candidatus Acidiferrales bacterium]